MIVALLGLAIDIGLMVQRHQQLKTASEAGALAGALELFGPNGMVDETTPDSRSPAPDPRRIAAEFAAANPIGARRVKVDLNLKNNPHGDIVLGTFEPPVLGSVFVPADGAEPGSGFGGRESGGAGPTPIFPPNALLVRTRHSQVGSGPILLLSQLVGVPSHDIYTESIAAVDRRLLGFRPVVCTRVPMLPLIVRGELPEVGSQEEEEVRGQRSEVREEEEVGGQGEEGEKETGDRFTVDPRTGEVWEGPDGIAEVELVIKVKEKKSGSQGKKPVEDEQAGRPSKPLEAKIVKFTDGDQPVSDVLAEQVLRGLTLVDLGSLGGEVRLGDQLACLSSPKSGEFPEIAQLHEALQAIVGQPRVLALGSWQKEDKGDSQDGDSDRAEREVAVVENFAACVVIDSQAASESLTIRVQPTLLNSCTAITGVGADRNLWIGKVLLVR